MAQASNQAQLALALCNQEPTIQITANFTLNFQICIMYDVTIESLVSGSSPHTIFKESGYDGCLFWISGGGTLRLANIILDGQSQLHNPDSPAARSLICVADGSLCLDTGAALQHNFSYTDGGGVSLCGGADCTNQFEMTGNARITGCFSRENGGGAAVSLSSPDDVISISEDSIIDRNSAANGGGIYFSSRVPGLGGTLSVSDHARITDNAAVSAGGGIWFSGYPGGGAPSLLSLDGPLVLSGNTSAHGAAVYFCGANSGDHMCIMDGTSITENTASGNGGAICYLAPAGSADLLIIDSSLTHNTAGTGGGLFLLTGSGGSATFLESSISENVAQNGNLGSGGGVWFRNTADNRPALISLNGTAVRKNTASAQGGGVYLDGGSGSFSLRMTRSSVLNNAASSNGGGLMMSGAGGIADILESAVADNTAGGSGGGIGAAERTQTNLFSGTIHSNRASRHGGGVWNHGGSVFFMNGGSIADNQAAYGGGFYNDSGSMLLLTGGAVSRNSAEAGGGIYNAEQSSVLLSSSIDFGGSGRNSASLYAPGIYNGGIFYTEGPRRIAEGVYLPSQSSVIRIQGPLAPGSEIQIDTSGYVSPNDAGVPIAIGEVSPPYEQLKENDRAAFMKPPSGFNDWEVQLNKTLTQILLVPIRGPVHNGNGTSSEPGEVIV